MFVPESEFGVYLPDLDVCAKGVQSKDTWKSSSVSARTLATFRLHSIRTARRSQSTHAWNPARFYARRNQSSRISASAESWLNSNLRPVRYHDSTTKSPIGQPSAEFVSVFPNSMEAERERLADFILKNAVVQSDKAAEFEFRAIEGGGDVVQYA